MNDDAQNAATPIDVYVAIGRRLGLDASHLTQLRRKGVFDRLTADDAEEMVGALCRAFGDDLAAQLMKEQPADYRRSVYNIEPRVSRLLSMCRGLNRRDVLKMMLRTTKVFTVDSETFSALMEAAIKLLPNESRRWTFLYAYPAYFALNPVLVGESVARGVTEDAHGGDHVALWSAINNETEQNAWVALTILFKTYKYRDVLRTRYLERLYANLGSYHAGMAFVSDLVAAGWLPEDVRATLGVYRPFRRAGSKHIVALQDLLMKTYGLKRYQVVAALITRPVLMFAPIDLFVERIRAALPDPTPERVDRLLHGAPMVLHQATEITIARRAWLEKEYGKACDQHLSLLAERRSMSAVMPEEPVQPEEEEADAKEEEPPAKLADPIGDLLYGPEPTQTGDDEERIPQRSPLFRSLPTVTEPEDTSEQGILLRTLGTLGISRNYRKSFVTRLLNEFGTASAVSTFVDRLRDAGWDYEACRLILTMRMKHRSKGADGLIALQQRLATEFTLLPDTAAMMVASHPHIMELPPDELCARIRSALPAPTRQSVERLLNSSPRILGLSVEELTRRRNNLLARKIDPGLSPRNYMHRSALHPPPAPPEPKRPAPVVVEDRLPPDTEPDEPLPPPPPPPPRVAYANTLEAIVAAGWDRQEAHFHQETFFDVKKLDPADVHHALASIQRQLGLSGEAFTQTLLDNVTDMIRRRDELKAAWRETREPRPPDLKKPLLPYQTTDAWRIAVGVHTHGAVYDALSILKRNGMTAQQAVTILAQHPELLTDDARPLAVVYWFEQTCQMASHRILPNLKDPDCRLAIFLLPEQIRKTLNKQRSLVTDFEDLDIEPSALDPSVRWSRLLCPLQELRDRLQYLLKVGWSAHKFQQEALKASAALRRELALQVAVQDALYAPSRSVLSAALSAQQRVTRR